MVIVICNLKEKTISHIFNVVCYKEKFNISDLYEGTSQLVAVSFSQSYPNEYVLYVIDLVYSEYHVFSSLGDSFYKRIDWDHYFD